MPENIREKQAIHALEFIMPLLKKYDFRWIITGGFACYVCGVSREITDIDIDIDASKDDPAFALLVQDIKPYVTQELIHFVDQNYDNYNIEMTYQNQVIDICPMRELMIHDPLIQAFRHLYDEKGGISYEETELVEFHGMKLPLMSKRMIIANKEMLVWKRGSDMHDVRELKKLMKYEKH